MTARAQNLIEAYIDQILRWLNTGYAGGDLQTMQYRAKYPEHFRRAITALLAGGMIQMITTNPKITIKRIA